MTHQMQSNELSEAVQLLADNGFEGMANAMQILFNEAMRLERTEYIGADPYERRWMVVSLVILITFMVTVTVAGFALGFQVPGDESRVDPRTVADSPPWSEPGLRDLERRTLGDL